MDNAKFLVALDDSPSAVVVLGQAERWARAAGAKMVLFRAVGLPTGFPLELLLIPPDRVEDHLKERARAELARLSESVSPELLAGIRVDTGVPWKAICDAATSERAGLIVIGSHGYRLPDRLLGTNAARVVNHADRTVLVVRAAPAEPAKKETP